MNSPLTGRGGYLHGVQPTGRPELDSIVRYAGGHSPFWAELLERVGRFEDIPPLTKPVVQASFDRILVPGLHPERMLRGWTSGSTGEPVPFVTDAWAGTESERARAWLLGLAGLPADIHTVLALTDPKLAPTLTNWTAFRMRDTVRENLRDRLAALDRVGDYVLYGMASAIEWMAVELERDGRPLPMRPPVAAITSADTLTLLGRARIESAFGCPVHSWYGSTETDPSLAGTPPGEHGRYVLNERRAYLEVADEEGRPCAPGERGQVLVTDLHNRCFPLLRYAVGDHAVMGEPGLDGHRFLERLEGRRSSIVELANGTRLTEGSLHFALLRIGRAVEQVQAMQGVQTGPMSLRLQVVWRAERDESVVRALDQACRDLWGAELEVEVIDVERLETLPNGKRWLLCGLEPAGRPT